MYIQQLNIQPEKNTCLNTCFLWFLILKSLPAGKRTHQCIKILQNKKKILQIDSPMYNGRTYFGNVKFNTVGNIIQHLILNS